MWDPFGEMKIWKVLGEFDVFRLIFPDEGDVREGFDDTDDSISVIDKQIHLAKVVERVQKRKAKEDVFFRKRFWPYFVVKRTKIAYICVKFRCLVKTASFAAKNLKKQL